jgi:signal transduction histidine kinase
VARSLRSRLVVGTLLWTGGLLFVIHLAVMATVHHALQGRPIELAPVGFGAGAAITIGAAVLFMAAGYLQVRRGMSALQQLQVRLAELRAGQAQRLLGGFPAEVEPLVADLNALLDARDEGVRRALAKAGDLAHGLKTPLAVLAQEADRAAARGDEPLADTLGQLVERMRRQVDYHLAQARAAGGGTTLGAAAPLLSIAEGLARTLERLYEGRGIAIELAVKPGHAARTQGQDLEEMLGNLLDNGCKWARTRVRLSSERVAERLVVAVDDDGPGLAPELREGVLARGARADESAPGSGLGLAIVRDVAALYGGTIALEAAPLGGVRALLTLPAAVEGGPLSAFRTGSAGLRSNVSHPAHVAPAHDPEIPP